MHLALLRHFYDVFVPVYEAGYCGYWIDRELKKLGINNIIVSPSDIPTTSRDKFEKTDPRDARNLAMHLQSSSFYVHPIQ